ncbi:hypothetical protein ABZ356_31620, partial [Micromonospora zamorensis]|uniref:hypothetical protein n=1 Tax=Micromonospora zamorensis TaxID=709883 RepID=UPI0034083B87
QPRAMATRYDKLAVRYEATLTSAAINQYPPPRVASPPPPSIMELWCWPKGISGVKAPTTTP